MTHSQRSPIRLDLIPNDLLTPEELALFTGYDVPRYQAEILKKNMIHYFTVRGGVIKTTWYHINNPTNLRVPHLAPSSMGIGWQKSFHPRTDYIPTPENSDLSEELKNFES